MLNLEIVKLQNEKENEIQKLKDGFSFVATEKITTQDHADQMAEQYTEGKLRIKKVIAWFKDAKEKASATHKNICRMENELKNPIKKSVDIMERALNAWETEKDRIRNAKLAEAAGSIEETVMVEQDTGYENQSGKISLTDDIEVKIIDFGQFFDAISRKNLPDNLVKIDLPAVKRWAKALALKDQVINGISVTAVKKTRVNTKAV